MSTKPTQAVIFAGGRGTRLQPLTDVRPKPMIEFHGKPFLEFLLEMLRDQGIERVVLLLGYLPDVVMDHFGTGSALGLDIQYRVTEPDDLTGRRLHEARDLLDETFLALYCDNYWPLRLDDLWTSFQDSGAEAQVVVYSNPDGYSRDGVRVEDGMVTIFDRTRSAEGLNGVEISYAIVSKDLVDELLPDDRQVLFEEAVYPPLIARRGLGAYVTEHRYYSVGSHERLPLTDDFLARRPAVILDRDGVLNERPPRAQYVRKPNEFVWKSGAREALHRLTAEGYRVVVVSNQAGINRGEMTADDLAAVNAKMTDEARETGGRIDAVYFCPHDWDEGCRCRKPAPGMLFQAQRDFDLDLSRTFFIGDDERDAQAARAAGARPALVSDAESVLDLTDRLLIGTLKEAAW
jgi:D-glycero-D-manno-heptose 1,7-bisphosphate phosphatase